MEKWAEIVLGVLGGILTMSIGAAVSKVWGLSNTVARVEQKLDDHIEVGRQEKELMFRKLADMDAKLPNGQLQKLENFLDTLAKRKRAKVL